MFFSRVLVLVRRGRHQPLVDVPAGPKAAELGAGAEDDGWADDLDLDADLDGVGDGDDLDPGPEVDADLDADLDAEEVLDNEPLARTLVFLVLGFVVMVAGLAAVIAG